MKRLVMLFLIASLLTLSGVLGSFAKDTSSSANADIFANDTNSSAKMDNSASGSDLRSTVPDIAKGWIGEPEGGE